MNYLEVDSLKSEYVIRLPKCYFAAESGLWGCKVYSRGGIWIEGSGS